MNKPISSGGLPLSCKGGIKSTNRITPGFKLALFKATAAFFLLGAIYLVMILGVILLALVPLAAAFLLAVSHRSWMIILLSLFLAWQGVFLWFALLKFLTRKEDNPSESLHEVTETDQPKLYCFIRDIAEKLKAPLPPKIYVSPGMETGIMYASGLRYLFRPVLTGLRIGLGAVNALSLSEFKAVLAQKLSGYSLQPMKRATVLDQANRTIHNRLYPDLKKDYLTAFFLQSRKARLSTLLICPVAAVIPWARRLMRKIYPPFARSFRRLARETKLYADAVAATIAGSSPVISALQRLELAGSCYTGLLSFQGWCQAENLQMVNWYPLHRELIRIQAEKYAIPFENGLPRLGAGFQPYFSLHRVWVTTRWNPGPCLREREIRLKAQDIVTAELVKEEAWAAFNHPEELQEQLTERMQPPINFRKLPGGADIEALHRWYRQSHPDFFLGKEYGGYYDERRVSPFDLEWVAAEVDPPLPESFEALFPADKRDLARILAGIRQDLETLEFIQEKGKQIRVFYFDEVQYPWTAAGEITSRLKEQLALYEKALQEQDKLVFRFFHRQALLQGREGELIAAYRHLFQTNGEAGQGREHCRLLLDIIRPVYEGELPEPPHKSREEMKNKESFIRDHIGKLLEDEAFLVHTDEKDISLLRQYFQGGPLYSGEERDDQPTINTLYKAVDCYARICWELPAMLQRKLLELQLELIKTSP